LGEGLHEEGFHTREVLGKEELQDREAHGGEGPF
jgi:hypothetical protein